MSMYVLMLAGVSMGVAWLSVYVEVRAASALSLYPETVHCLAIANS